MWNSFLFRLLLVFSHTFSRLILHCVKCNFITKSWTVHSNLFSDTVYNKKYISPCMEHVVQKFVDADSGHFPHFPAIFKYMEHHGKYCGMHHHCKGTCTSTGLTILVLTILMLKTHIYFLSIHFIAFWMRKRAIYKLYVMS